MHASMHAASSTSSQVTVPPPYDFGSPQPFEAAGASHHLIHAVDQSVCHRSAIHLAPREQLLSRRSCSAFSGGYTVQQRPEPEQSHSLMPSEKYACTMPRRPKRGSYASHSHESIGFGNTALRYYVRLMSGLISTVLKRLVIKS